jgi:Zn-dependent alcohol dehydrogenases
VAAIGRAVRGVKEGDRVGIPWLHTACGHCSYCRTGWETLCGSQLNSGYSVNGSFAEYALADPAYVGRLPNNLEWGPAAPILCAGVTVYKGLRETEVRPGEWVVISGIGGLGHMAVQYAKAMGMHVAAVDVHPEKLELAKSLGAEIVSRAGRGRRGRDAKADPWRPRCARHGRVTEGIRTGLRHAAVARHDGAGRSAARQDVAADLQHGSQAHHRARLHRRNAQDLEEALAFAGSGAVSAHFSWDNLENINDIFARMEDGKIDGRIVANLQ